MWTYYNCMPWSFGTEDDAFNQIAPYIYAEQQLNSSCEWVTVPGRGTKFQSTGNSTGADYGFRLAIVDLVITLHRVPYLPSAAVLAAAGSINSIPYLGVNTGQLLFNGSQTHRTHTTNGTSSTDVTYLFAARSQPWDFAFNPASGAWERVVSANGGNPFIPAIDLSQIIPSTYSF